jgi:Fic family protein
VPELIKLSWPFEPTSGLPRSARRGCEYEAYVPDALSDRAIVLTGTTAAEVADAERAVEGLNREAESLADSEAMARLLLRAEAVASSKIEGLEVGGRRLLKAQLARGLSESASDVSATEVLNNVDAMRVALDSLGAEDEITVERLLVVHGRLLAGTSLREHAGKIREQQNWIGGSSYNPCSATFVPPPPERVPELLDDLCAFCNGDGLPPLTQAALAHAQFETIHPFIDGNGRTGRVLIHMLLRRRGLAPRVVPPISLILATWSKDYVEGLTVTRYRGVSSSDGAIAAVNVWISLFAAATIRAVADAEAYEQTVAEVQAEWRKRLVSVRSDSAIDRLVNALPGAPVITVRSAAGLIGRSEQAVNQAIPRLLDAGVLTQTTIGRRNRAFEAVELIDAFTGLERALASPDGDTRHSPPARPVPRRQAGLSRSRVDRRSVS